MTEVGFSSTPHTTPFPGYCNYVEGTSFENVLLIVTK